MARPTSYTAEDHAFAEYWIHQSGPAQRMNEKELLAHARRRIVHDAELAERKGYTAAERETIARPYQLIIDKLQARIKQAA